MEITARSTSSLMSRIFGDDIGMITDIYAGRIKKLAEKNDFLSPAFGDCFGRTSFLLPYMCCEYSYNAVRGGFMPPHLKRAACNFGLICLVTGIDDDIVDEYSREGDHLKLICNISASESLQNAAYTDMFSHHPHPYAATILSEKESFLRAVWKYQHMDSMNMRSFRKGFDLPSYLEACHKTACYTVHGLRLGVLLAAGSAGELERAEKLGRLLGQTLQLYDDLLDLPDDMTNYPYPVTLPMVLSAKGEGFLQVLDIIDSNLSRALRLAGGFRNDEKPVSMVNGFSGARGLVTARLPRKAGG